MVRRATCRAAILVYILLSLAIILLAFFARDWLPDQRWRLGLPPPEPTAYEQARHELLIQLDHAADPNAPRMIGDSFVEGFDPGLLGGEVLVYGIGGATLREWRNRLHLYPGLQSSRRVIIWAGYNDLAHRSPEEIGEDLDVMLGQFPVSSSIFVTTLVSGRDAKKAGRVSQTNLRYRKICDAHPRCKLVDSGGAVAGQDGLLSPEFDRGDGIHLNRKGYQRIGAILRDELARSDETDTKADTSAGQGHGRGTGQ